MSQLTIPTKLSELTPEWLTDALKSGGFIEKSTVTGASAKEIGAGTGLMSAIGRVELEYDAQEPDAPKSLVAKVQAEAPENLMVALTFGFYKREVDFYRYAAPVSVLRAPRAYYLDIDESGQNFVLLLEDFGKATLDQVQGAPAEISYKALMELARHHAQFNAKVLNKELDWALESFSDDYVGINTMIYQTGLEPALTNFSSHFNTKTKKIAEDLSNKITPLMKSGAEEAMTLIHGDFRLDNMFMGKLPPREGFPEEGLGVVDWQINCIAECGFDLAYHMCCIDTETRRKLEAEALKDYHQVLLSEGVKGYSFDYFKEQYRRYILFSLLYGISVAGHLDLANERGVELAKTYLDRTLTAIEDNDSGDLMPQ